MWTLLKNGVIDNSQLTPGSTVQFVKNGQLHTATSAPGNHGQISHQLHQVTTPGGVPSARRILPQAQISNHTSPEFQIVSRMIFRPKFKVSPKIGILAKSRNFFAKKRNFVKNRFAQNPNLSPTNLNFD